jgi:uncharacterized protein YndB with AHSA1/START domain
MTKDFTISRAFEAPREAVWEAWTRAEALAQWWGPKGFDLGVHRLDMKPGGMFLYSMKTGSQEMWGRFIYREIVRPERMVFVTSFSDPDGNVTRAPFFDGKWPLEVLNTVTFTENGRKTVLDLRGAPIDPTPEESAAFAANAASMQAGFGGTFDKLEAYLATVPEEVSR